MKNDTPEMITTAAKRYFAFLLDYTIILLFLKGIFPLFLSKNWDILGTTIMDRPFFLFYLIGIVLFLCKDIFSGQSPGKRFLGLRVCNVDKELSSPSLKALLARNAFLLLLPVEMFAMLFDKYARRLGDKFAKTLVVEKKSNPEVRRLTVKVVGGILILSFLWMTAILCAPIGITKTKGYELALNLLKNNPVIEQRIGQLESVGYWPEREKSAQSDKALLRLDLQGTKAKAKIEFILDYAEKQKVRLTKMTFLPN